MWDEEIWTHRVDHRKYKNWEFQVKWKKIRGENEKVDDGKTEKKNAKKGEEADDEKERGKSYRKFSVR